MPPPTPSTSLFRKSATPSSRQATRLHFATTSRPRYLLTLGVLEQTGVDFAQRDGQRLLTRARLDQRADVLEQALAELRVVVVDLTSTLSSVDRQRVLGADLLEQVVDWRVGDAF